MKIDFLKFLQNVKDKNFWENKKIVCFNGSNDYPFLFFAKLFRFLDSKNILPMHLKILNLDSIEKRDLFINLNQSFLGQSNFYWLSELEFTRSLKNSLEIFNFLINYNGDNFVSFYVKDEKIGSKYKNISKKICIVDVQEEIDLILFENLLELFEKNIKDKKSVFVKKLFRQVGTIFLDKSILLIRYLELMNSKTLEDFYEYIFQILIDVSPSINLLSRYFFENKAELFFKIWSQVHNDYSEMFWISFWTDKIWRAYYFVKFCKLKKFRQARIIGFGLPFMFMERGWQNFSLNRLSNYYQFLYNNDFSFKTGSTFCSLDLFYLNHFSEKNFLRERI